METNNTELLEWLRNVKFAGYRRFEVLEKNPSIIRCISSGPDGKDSFLDIAFARTAEQHKWTFEKCKEYWNTHAQS